MQIVGRTWLNLVTWKVGHEVKVSMTFISRSSDFVISWRLFDVCTSYLGSMNQYDPTFDLKINVGNCDLYSIVRWFFLLKKIWCMNNIIWDYESVWPKVWPQNKYRSLFGIMSQYDPKFDLKINVGHCDLYSMVQWFCLISWRLFDAWTLLFWIMSQYDPKLYLKINIGHCDLYCMAQWFCVISWRLFDVWTSYFGIKGQYDLTFDLKINVGLCDLYFMVQWLCLISPRLFDAWVSYFQIMRQCDPNFDLKVNISQHDLYFMV